MSSTSEGLDFAQVTPARFSRSFAKRRATRSARVDNPLLFFSEAEAAFLLPALWSAAQCFLDRSSLWRIRKPNCACAGVIVKSLRASTDAIMSNTKRISLWSSI
ncbi:hypothetical protein D3C76_1294040 [compost metagenome]